MLSLLLLVAVVAFVVWLLSMLPFMQPFKQVLYGVGIFIIVVAALQVIFGLDLLGAAHNLGNGRFH